MEPPTYDTQREYLVEIWNQINGALEGADLDPELEYNTNSYACYYCCSRTVRVAITAHGAGFDISVLPTLRLARFRGVSYSIYRHRSVSSRAQALRTCVARIRRIHHASTQGDIREEIRKDIEAETGCPCYGVTLSQDGKNQILLVRFGATALRKLGYYGEVADGSPSPEPRTIWDHLENE